MAIRPKGCDFYWLSYLFVKLEIFFLRGRIKA